MRAKGQPTDTPMPSLCLPEEEYIVLVVDRDVYYIPVLIAPEGFGYGTPIKVRIPLVGHNFDGHGWVDPTGCDLFFGLVLNGDEQSELYRMSVFGNTPRRLTYTSEVSEEHVTGFEDKLYFTSQDFSAEAPVFDVDSMTLLGNGRRVEVENCSDPAVSPDGLYLACTGTESEMVEVYDLSSGQMYPGFAGVSTVWRPDGRALSFLGGNETFETYIFDSVEISDVLTSDALEYRPLGGFIASVEFDNGNLSVNSLDSDWMPVRKVADVRDLPDLDEVYPFWWSRDHLAVDTESVQTLMQGVGGGFQDEGDGTPLPTKAVATAVPDATDVAYPAPEGETGKTDQSEQEVSQANVVGQVSNPIFTLGWTQVLFVLLMGVAMGMILMFYLIRKGILFILPEGMMVVPATQAEKESR